jgi:predicted membrane channel-forming protein YqfA (hemolysin III family)
MSMRNLPVEIITGGIGVILFIVAYILNSTSKKTKSDTSAHSQQNWAAFFFFVSGGLLTFSGMKWYQKKKSMLM